MVRNWTKQETEYLEKFYEKRGVSYIAKKLNRTVHSVKNKARTLGLNAYICEDLYVRTIARCFNSHPRVINRWIEKYGLPYKTVQRGAFTCKLISADKFWKWAMNHKELIPWERYEKSTILPEPEWVKEAIKAYAVKNHRKRVTPLEEQYVVLQKRQGKSFEQIAKELDRTVDSVKHMWRKRKEDNKNESEKESNDRRDN